MSASLKPFVTLEKNGTKSLQEMNWGFFIDTSGSTDTGFHTIPRPGQAPGLSKQDKILGVEIDLVTKIRSLLGLGNTQCIVGWDSTAKLYNSENDLEPNGATDPSSIFDVPKIREHISKIQGAVIITDGDINKEYVEKFGKLIKEKASHLESVIELLSAEEQLIQVSLRYIPGMSMYRF